MTRTTRRIRIICLTVLALAVILPILLHSHDSIRLWVDNYRHELPMILFFSITGGLLLILFVHAVLWLIDILENDTTGIGMMLRTIGILLFDALCLIWFHASMTVDWIHIPFSWIPLSIIPILESGLFILRLAHTTNRQSQHRQAKRTS
ncbi:hypothetical protein [Bifidobacterium sp. SO1]|uniref:hypothetical protein n=1 Tax=Bifidobacterium sp. SO1 TaxID=2809029 RepID=UPI001BDC3E59|nr:hypothetical protein [Bifidobacterium sp. SO1]MBT1162819.1 hypothetical protein [Bifidobacterium sp. SO1]